MKRQRLRKIGATWAERLDESRIHLARPDALLPLAFLGLLTGLLAGGVIVLFRLFVEGVQDAILPGSGSENYEALSGWGRLLLPLLAAVLLAAMFRWVAQGITLLGVAGVMERMAYHQGRFPTRGFLLQFFGAAFAIIGGHSVGREVPHVYLGASSGSLLAQHLGLPNNVTRALVGCGAAAGIAASFNTPLAGVVKLTPIEQLNAVLVVTHNPRYMDEMADLISETDLTDEQRLYADCIRSSAGSLLHLINDVLDLSRIEAGRYELQEQAVTLADVAEDCRRLLKLRAEKKGLNIIQNYQQGLPQIWADERAIRQVCLNLLSNAIKFNNSPEPAVDITVTPGARTVEIAVSDNGPGIPPEHASKLFNKFEQIKSNQKGSMKSQKGTGLGLAITKGIVEAHRPLLVHLHLPIRRE